VQPDSEALRIGEFARRVGVSAELLRAWERRYGLLQPVRSPGGFRLYGSGDAERVERMRRGLDAGLSAAEAARVAVASGRSTEGLLENAATRLLTAIHEYDEGGVHAVLDECFGAFGLDTVLRELILPTLTEVGQEWQHGTLAVGQEHFASNLIRARLLSVARLWGRGSGSVALLACPPNEHHDIGLLAFGLILRSHGWRILFLGADTPIFTIEQVASSTNPALTVLAAFDPAPFEAHLAEIRRLAKQVPLVLSGPGASEELCGRLRVERLDGDLIEAAHDTARRSRSERLSTTPE
jgi:MerR family transcriptional regulator, light-induced transcriptional regulator